MAELNYKTNCNSCGSSDANAVYNDNSTHCFSCLAHTYQAIDKKDAFITRDQEYTDLATRKIKLNTCKKYHYFKYHNQEIANYYNATGDLVAQKIRYPNKIFKTIGKINSALLFGANLFGSGKYICITEGEIDALTISQIFNNKYASVSVGSGASGAYKHIANNLEYFKSFETVILMFDNDDVGRKSAHKVAELFSYGKCKIATLTHKDANEAYVNNAHEEIISAFFNAKELQPSGIINAVDLWDRLIESKETFETDIPYPYPRLNYKLGGLRRSELVLITAGSGTGKTIFCKEIAYHLAINHNIKIGMLMLEESPLITAKTLMSYSAGYPIHQKNLKEISNEFLQEHFNNVFSTKNIFIYDHFGSTSIENITNRIRYLAKCCQCKFIFLDHISMVFSGLNNTNERQFIDQLMTKLRSVVQELNIGLIAVSHLSRTDERGGHEKGAEVSLSQLRGSHSLAQLSDAVIALERNQQADDTEISDVKVRILKNRFNGMTGVVGNLKYEEKTGRLVADEIHF